jgi:hypothetical protein
MTQSSNERPEGNHLLSTEKGSSAAAGGFSPTPEAWRTMASAPKDGSIFIVERPDWSSSSVSLAFWHVGQNVPGWVHADYKATPVDLRYYKLWAPLPAPPKENRADERDGVEREARNELPSPFGAGHTGVGDWRDSIGDDGHQVSPPYRALPDDHTDPAYGSWFVPVPEQESPADGRDGARVSAASGANTSAWRDAIEAAAKVCSEHAAFLHKEAHSGGDFAHLVARRTEAAYLEKRILALSLPIPEEGGGNADNHSTAGAVPFDHNKR